MSLPILVFADYEEWAENPAQAEHIARIRYNEEPDEKVLSRVVSDIEQAKMYDAWVEEVVDEKGLTRTR